MERMDKQRSTDIGENDGDGKGGLRKVRKSCGNVWEKLIKNAPPANESDDLLLICRRNGKLEPSIPGEWLSDEASFDVGLKYGDMLIFLLLNSLLLVLF